MRGIALGRVCRAGCVCPSGSVAHAFSMTRRDGRSRPARPPWYYRGLCGPPRLCPPSRAHDVSFHCSTPRPGMIATVRNRRGLIAAVEPFDSTDGRLHLVRVEYTDNDGVAEDTVLWEREQGRDLLQPNALPQVETEA